MAGGFHREQKGEDNFLLYDSDIEFMKKIFMDGFNRLFCADVFDWKEHKTKEPKGYPTIKFTKEDIIGFLDHLFFCMAMHKKMPLFDRIKELIYPQVRAYILEQVFDIFSLDTMIDITVCRIFMVLYYNRVIFEYEYGDDETEYEDALKIVSEMVEEEPILPVVLQFIDMDYFNNMFMDKLIKNGVPEAELPEKYEAGIDDFMNSLDLSKLSVNDEYYDIDYILKYVI